MKSKKQLPFKETNQGDKKIRVFSENTDSGEYKWHRDREDRLIEVIEGDDWYLQLDNELPKKLTPGTIFIIPEGVYHRVIKGSDSLKISITLL